MSGLVIGLQNRARRFESASDLQKAASPHRFAAFFFLLTTQEKYAHITHLSRIMINFVFT